MGNNFDNKGGVIEESQFNMGLAILQRIDNLLTSCALFSQRKMLDRWLNVLLPLSRQVDYDFKEDERKINHEFKTKLFKLEQEYQIYKSRDQLGKFKRFGYFYDMLGAYESFLRRCLNKRKMLVAQKNESSLF